MLSTAKVTWTFRWPPEDRQTQGDLEEEECRGGIHDRTGTDLGGYLERCAADRPRCRDLLAALRSLPLEED